VDWSVCEVFISLRTAGTRGDQQEKNPSWFQEAHCWVRKSF